MRRRETAVIAFALILASEAVWAFSPYYPGPIHARTAAPTTGQRFPATAPHAYPMPIYRPAPTWYPPPPPASRTSRGTKSRRVTPPAPAPVEQATSTRPGPAASKTPPPVDRGPANASQAPAPREHQTEFLERLQPLVERENARLLRLREELSDLIDRSGNGVGLRKEQRERIRELANRYRVDGDPLKDTAAARELLEKVDQVPVSLALAQAANESAWGKSRFAREGNNLFGIWTYDESQGMVPRNRKPGQKHLVRRFDSIADSVRYYMFTLNSHPAYVELRAIRADLRREGRPLDGHALADGLTRYSAKGEEYVRLIRAMIRRFDLAVFDGTADRRA
jgi:Bax protein